MNELKSYTEYAVSTPTADFVIGFDFNYGEDAVNVTVDDVPATTAGYTVVYLNETTIRLSPSVPSGVVRLQRETDIDQTDHEYRAGAKFIAQTMDENFEQLRHSQQEVRDGFSKLSADTNEIIEGLDTALELAQYAAQDAQDAAVIAQGAADTVNTIIVEGKVGASNVLDASEETQQQVNYNGGSKWHSRVGGYKLNERVVLTNGDIVKSTIDGNANDPNVDMTGWVFDDNCVESVEKLRLRNPKNGERVYLISVNDGQMEGGGYFVATQKSGLVDDGGIIISTNAPNIFYVRINFDEVSPEMFGAKINDKSFDSATALQASFSSGYPVSCRGGSYYSSKPLFHRSGFKLKGEGFWNKTRIFKTTSDVGDLPSILSPNGIDSISYQKDAVLIAIPDSGDYCHDVEIKDVLIGREWDELNPLFLTGYSYYAPYIAQSKFDSVWFNATRYTWYSVNQWMCTFNRCEGAGGEWVVGGLDGDLVRGGTTSTYNSCWSKVVHIAGANAWSFTNMTTVTMNSCGTDGLGLSSFVGGAVVKAKNSGITFNGFGIEVTHSENLFNFENCAVNIKALHFHEMFNNYGRLFIINGGVVNISCSILEMVNKDTAVNIPDFALVSNGGSFKIDNVISDPPIFGLTNAPQSKNAVIIAADSHGLIDANGSRQEWSEGSGINKTNRAIQINNHSDNIGVIDPTAIHYATNSFQLGNARLFRDSSGLLRQTRNNDPTDQYDGVPVGGIPIYPDNSSAKNIEGNVYFNSTTSMLMIYNGAAWRAISSVGS